MRKEDIEKQINRIKDSIFKFNKLEIIMDDNIFIQIKNLNELRREAIHKLEEKRIYKKEFEKQTYKIDVPRFPKKQETSYLISTLDQYNNINNYDYLYIDDKPSTDYIGCPILQLLSITL